MELPALKVGKPRPTPVVRGGITNVWTNAIWKSQKLRKDNHQKRAYLRVPFLYIKKQDLLFLTKILIFFNLAYYMCGAEPAGNIPAPMLQQYIYKRKKRGKTNGKEKIK